ncbi:hypothetical protein [Halomonas sp. 25-S5]|nr:hypothetical protein [Halomonas sp. 25-S5]
MAFHRRPRAPVLHARLIIGPVSCAVIPHAEFADDVLDQLD